MNQWEQDIKIKNLERALSIVFQVEQISKSTDDELGAVVDNSIEKSGAEVKEKLLQEIELIQAKKGELVSKMETLVKAIGSHPEGHANTGLVKGYENHLGEVPMQFTYSQIYADGIEKAAASGMREFNQLSADCIRHSIEEVRFKSVVNNLSDDQVVKLTPALADEFGFEKAEGSRGGKVIGHTKSGKPIYLYKKNEEREYSPEDHKDAANLHAIHSEKQSKIAEKHGGYGEGMLANHLKHHHDEMSKYHEKQVKSPGRKIHSDTPPDATMSHSKNA